MEALKEAYIFEFETRLESQSGIESILGKRAGIDQGDLPASSWEKALATPQLWYWYLAYRELDPDGARDRFAEILPFNIVVEMEKKMDS